MSRYSGRITPVIAQIWFRAISMEFSGMIETSWSMLRLSAVLAAAVFLTACLSGRSESDDPVVGQSGTAAVNSNSPPSISGSPDLEAKAGENYAFTPNASDPDGDALTFAIENKPSWAAFNSTTGTLSGTPDSADEGNYERISISVSDGISTASLPVFNVAVVTVGGKSITLSWTPPSQNVDGSALTDLAGYRIYYGLSSSNYTAKISIDNPGIATYVIEDLLNREYYIVATSINADGVESAYSKEIVRNAT